MYNILEYKAHFMCTNINYNIHATTGSKKYAFQNTEQQIMVYLNFVKAYLETSMISTLPFIVHIITNKCDYTYTTEIRC